MRQILIAIAAFVLCASCAAHKRVNYLQDISLDQPEKIAEQYQIRIKPLDKLIIIVNSKDPELAAPFNTSTSLNSLTGVPTGYSSTNTNMLQERTVDEDGYLLMPIIGKIECAGKTRTELERDIERIIYEGGYISDPTVNVSFADLKIAVLGEVKNPGYYNVINDRMTIFDAVAMAGDLTVYGIRDNVKVIREVDGKRVTGSLDLTKQDLFNSPYFYIQQNDIIYVTPNKYKAQTAEINQNRTFYLSVASTLVSIATLVISIISISR